MLLREIVFGGTTVSRLDEPSRVNEMLYPKLQCAWGELGCMWKGDIRQPCALGMAFDGGEDRFKGFFRYAFGHFCPPLVLHKVALYATYATYAQFLIRIAQK